jgi:hypothetical protein
VTARFAAAQARANAAVIRHLANTEAEIMGATVPGLFDQGYAEGVAGLVSGSNLAFTCLADAVPEIERGEDVTIGEDGFTVAGVEPDGTGLVRLVLLRA